MAALLFMTAIAFSLIWGGDFVDAILNGNLIFALLKSGRVQELRVDGRFVRDIVSNNAVGIRLSDDILIVRTANGRFDQYKNGKQIYSSSTAPSAKTTSAKSARTKGNKSEAEKLGEKAGEMLFDALGKFIRFVYAKLKERFVK